MITTEGIPECNDLKKPRGEKFTLVSLGSQKLWGTHRNVIASVNQLSKVGDKSVIRVAPLRKSPQAVSEILLNGNKMSAAHWVRTCPSERRLPLRCVYRNLHTAPLLPRSLGYTCRVNGGTDADVNHPGTRGDSTRETRAAWLCSVTPSPSTPSRRGVARITGSWSDDQGEKETRILSTSAIILWEKYGRDYFHPSKRLSMEFK